MTGTSLNAGILLSCSKHSMCKLFSRFTVESANIRENCRIFVIDRSDRRACRRIGSLFLTQLPDQVLCRPPTVVLWPMHPQRIKSPGAPITGSVQFTQLCTASGLHVMRLSLRDNRLLVHGAMPIASFFSTKAPEASSLMTSRALLIRF